MLDSLKPNGIALLSCAAKEWDKGVFKEAAKLREVKGRWELVDEVEDQNYNIYKELARHDRFFVYRKLK